MSASDESDSDDIEEIDESELFDYDGDADTESEDKDPDRRSLTGAIIATLPRLIPKWTSIYRTMAIKSIENYHKASDGDAVAIDARAGQQLDLTPVKYRTAEECDEEEKPGWVEKSGDKVWNAASEGRVVDYLGRAPIVALDRDSHVECGWLKPRIAEAIELDQYGPVYTDPNFDVTIDAQAGAGQARADGGVPGSFSMDLQDPGRWAGDALIDLDSGEGYDGMRVSFRKASEWQAETTTSQEMAMQQERGFLMGLMDADSGPSIVKLMILCAAIILGVLAIVIIGPDLVGGDGGSSMNPLTMMPGLLGAI